jgi:NAD(P)H-hydrate epimerase
MQIIKDIPKLKPRATDAHKGDFGRVCIIGGCIGMSGAAALAGRAALRSGAGLVRVAESVTLGAII